MHMLNSSSPMFKEFGEIYFSTVNPGIIKAWKKHYKMTQLYAVPIGKIRLVLFDDRKDSKTSNKIEVVEMGEDNYCLVKIPPMIWYGFKGLSSVPALIANCTNIPHDPKEMQNLDVNSPLIPYKW